MVAIMGPGVQLMPVHGRIQEFGKGGGGGGGGHS